MAKRITVKEIYERIIRLEAKVDFQTDINVVTRKYFTRVAWLIIFLEIVNIIVHYLL